MRQALQFRPKSSSRFLVAAVFLLPVLIVPLVGFAGIWQALLSALLIVAALRGITLLVPSWNVLKLDGQRLILRSGPWAAREIPCTRLEPAGRWTFFILPAYAERPVLVWRDAKGRRREQPLFHIYASGLEETRDLLSGKLPNDVPASRAVAP